LSSSGVDEQRLLEAIISSVNVSGVDYFDKDWNMEVTVDASSVVLRHYYYFNTKYFNTKVAYEKNTLPNHAPFKRASI
jgi:hypothetical protein